ncbi:TRAP transporter large permease [Algihabitans albus]|uniref:TRAP transporter large permease n=1 Tax=Algihabitans albus TaxID=2164067 RepID=UPI000E5CC034|nr:TRAP transporter large permease [Algihabitans albus]
MSPPEVGLSAIGVLLILLVLRCPVALAMIVTGLGGFALLASPEAALAILGNGPWDVATNYAFTLVPLFLLMGNLAAQAGLSRDLFAAARRLLAGWRGGLPLAAVLASGGFSAVSGSSLATAATMARVALPEMRAQGTAPRLAAGALAAGGTLGIMIPPSIALLLYALITQQSVEALFLAGFLPGLLAILLYGLTIAILVRLRPELGGRALETAQIPLVRALKPALPVLALFLLVMGGLYGGLFTPTEAAGAGAFLTLLVALARGVRWPGLRQALIDTLRTTAAIFLIIIGAEIFGYLLSVSQIPAETVALIRDLGLAPWMVLAAILVFFVLLGCVMDSLAMILLTVPVFYPLILEAGYDPIWFGILAVVAVELGLITPPVGMNLFVISSVAPEVKSEDVMFGALPFVVADLLRLGILAAFPIIALALPGWFGLL